MEFLLNHSRSYTKQQLVARTACCEWNMSMWQYAAISHGMFVGHNKPRNRDGEWHD